MSLMKVERVRAREREEMGVYLIGHAVAGGPGCRRFARRREPIRSTARAGSLREERDPGGRGCGGGDATVGEVEEAM
jgi:hypothetical protein